MCRTLRAIRHFQFPSPSLPSLKLLLRQSDRAMKLDLIIWSELQAIVLVSVDIEFCRFRQTQ
jgi:hypothetical protein